uniref:Small ribosomal subunit protein uS8c n=1 Tax=Chaetophoropsis polyrhiza TaxID=2079440 RepID=A0A6H1U777_9CHLO|nr:ribosomal protein S8 [Chaetophoropsis polyrhiza]QIZ74237.1 ribosomal protein S8 [Chaetophoropsis polyrhiza]
MINDTISDMLTRIRNASSVRKKIVLIPYTKMNLKITEILEKEGYILSFEITSSNNLKLLKIYLKYYKKYKTNYYKLTVIKNKKALSDFKNLVKLLKGKQGNKKTPCITNLKRVSKPGLRIYVNQKELPRVLAGTGIYILSTSKGILTDREARFRGIGGEVLCSVW